MEQDNAFAANRALWDARTELHYTSAFYDVEGFLKGKNTLNSIELDLLGDVRGLDVLHLQCHFGQDTLSLARSGARATGLDLSPVAVTKARELAERCGLPATFIESNVIDFRGELEDHFDVVFTSYGTIGWLPDLKPWAANVACYLKPGGRFVMAEFHPAVWMFDNDFTHVAYPYFNRAAIIEHEQGSYAAPDAPLQLESYSWNHSLADVLTVLMENGLHLEVFREFDRSPYDCFRNTVASSDGHYFIKGMEGKLPMVYALRMQKR